MPGWTEIATGFEGQKWSNVIQYVRAVNERFNIDLRGYDWIPEPSVDDVTGQHETFYDEDAGSGGIGTPPDGLQQAVVGLIPRYVNREDYPGPTYEGEPNADFMPDGPDPVPCMYTIATFKEHTGLTGDGTGEPPDYGIWRRMPTWTATALSYDDGTDKTTVTSAGDTPFKAAHVGKNIEFTDADRGWFEITDYVSTSVVKVSGNCETIGTGSMRFSILPSDFDNYDDAAWWYGPCREDDVLGKHLFVDLQIALNHLTWARLATGFETGDTERGDADWAWQSKPYALSLAAAKDNAWAAKYSVAPPDHIILGDEADSEQEPKHDFGTQSCPSHPYDTLCPYCPIWPGYPFCVSKSCPLWPDCVTYPDCPLCDTYPLCPTAHGYAGARSRGKYTFTACDREKDIDWYVGFSTTVLIQGAPFDPPDEYFADGMDDGEGEGKLALIQQDTDVTSTGPKMDWYGTLDEPGTDPDADVTRGCGAETSFVIVKMDRPGGFEYY